MVKTKSIWEIVELVLTISIGLFLDIVLHQREMAYVVVSIGILLTLSTFIINQNFTKKINNISRTQSLINDIPYKKLQKMAIKLQKDLEKTLLNLTLGTYNLEVSDSIDELINSVRGIKYRLLAISYMDQEDWRNRVGLQAYLIEQEKKIKDLKLKPIINKDKKIERGIFRVFILEEKDASDIKLYEIVEEQLQKGITVKITKQNSLPIDLRKDFALFDDKKVIDPQMDKYKMMVTIK